MNVIQVYGIQIASAMLVIRDLKLQQTEHCDDFTELNCDTYISTHDDPMANACAPYSYIHGRKAVARIVNNSNIFPNFFNENMNSE